MTKTPRDASRTGSLHYGEFYLLSVVL